MRQVFFWCVTGLFCLICAAGSAQDRAAELLNRVDDLYRAGSSRAVLSMTVKTAHYERTLEMEAWSKGKDKSLVRILAPRKEKGTSTLKSGTALYTYLPKTDRTIRLTSGLMLGSWMGSHFTNDDLVKESRLADDYTAKVTFEGQRDGVAVIELTLTPKPDSAVTWGKIVTVVRTEDSNPVQTVYYDEDGEAARRMKFTKIASLGGRMLPTVLEMTPADKPGEYTRLHYKELALGVEIDDSRFSLRSLKR